MPSDQKPAACSAPPGGQTTFATEEEITGRLVGAWQICSHPSIFASQEDGLEITADHRWYKLERTTDGTFRRLQGWDNEGEWSVTDMSDWNGPGSWQLGFGVDGGGALSTHPLFAAKVQRMHLDNNGVWKADYVKLSGQSPDVPPPDQSEPPCSVPEGGEAEILSEDAFVERLVGRWELCEKPSAFGSDEDGLEITSDHKWYKLHRAQNGSLVRMLGKGDHGEWFVTDTSSMNGPGSWQVDFATGNGTVITHPIFAVSVPKMRLNNNGVHQADYIKLPA